MLNLTPIRPLDIYSNFHEIQGIDEKVNYTARTQTNPEHRTHKRQLAWSHLKVNVIRNIKKD